MTEDQERAKRVDELIRNVNKLIKENKAAMEGKGPLAVKRKKSTKSK